MNKPAKKKQLVVGDEVIKTGGDYRFKGIVVCVFRKLEGQIRYVVENEDGKTEIFKPTEVVTTMADEPTETEGGSEE